MKNDLLKKIPLFFFGIFLAVSVWGQSVTKNFTQTPLKEVLEEVGRQTGFSIIYEKKEINEKKLITKSFQETSLKEVLTTVLDSSIGYSAENNVITLFSKKEENKSSTQIAQNPNSKPITGKILDDQGETLIGATVKIKGTTQGAITDMDGYFTLNAAQGSVLEVSYLGYTSAEIAVGAQSEYVVKLKENLRNLEEVVVVGYGIQKKVNLSGSVAAISADQIQDRVQSDVLSAIQGTVLGVTIISRPGAAPSINFRGRGNLGTSSEPLFVIDGAISDAAFFSNLDPNSIESISFLKDAASASIYGSRAAFGVVLVKTKRGSTERFQASYSGMVGMQTPSYKPKFVNSAQYAELFNEAKYNTNPSLGKHQTYSEEEIGWFRDGSKPDLYPNTDWIDLVFNDWSVTTQHSVNFTGGSEKVNYFVGLGYLYNNEYMPNRDRQRYNMDFNISSKLTNWLSFNAGIKYIQNFKKVDSGTPRFDEMAIVPVTFVAKQSNGDWGSVESGREASGTFAGGNPLRTLSKNDWSRNKWERTMFNLGLDMTPMEGLVISGNGVYNKFDKKNKSYIALMDEVPSFLNPGTTIGGTGNTINKMDMDWLGETRLLLTGTARYDKTIGIHTFGALVGTSFEKFKSEQLSASRQDFPYDGFEDMSGGATSGANYKNNSGSYEDRMFSYFARINYTLMDRYIFEGNIRADASSRFHKDKRWGYFPSFSTAWRISEEDFMTTTREWVDNLKIRVSYGTLGNINNVGYYDYMATYKASKDYSFSNNPVKGITESRPANPDLTWETVTLTDFGLDIDLWGGKLSATADYYIKNTSDILLQYNVPAETGIPSNAKPSQNMAKVRNTGFELALTHRNKIGDVSYTISGNIATNRNRITDLASSDNIIQNYRGADGVEHGIPYILREGKSIGSFYGFKADGLYTQEEIDEGKYYTYGGVTPNAGDIKFVPQRDIKHKESLTDGDRTIIGKDVPDFTYGFNLSVMYKNFEFSVFGQGISGTEVPFTAYQLHPFFHGQDNPRVLHLSRWSEENPNRNASYPRIYDASSSHTTYNRTFSEYSLFDSDYFRFKTISLGYLVPKKAVSKIGLSSLKFYLTAENMLTIRADTKMKDFDPETGGGLIRDLGVKSLAFGVNVSF